MIALLLAAFASAGTLDGWENSRWLVELEETLPMQLAIAGPDANPPVVRAFQLQGVLVCPEFQMSGKKAAFVGCEFESLALRASPQAHPGDRLAEYEQALKNLHITLASGKLEFKVRDDGRLGTIDFEPPPKTEQIVVEATRALATDLASGFSLLREAVPEGSPWDEKNSPLMRAPTQPMGNGLTKIRHQPIDHQGKRLLQSTGDGTYTSNYMSWGAGRVEQVRASAAAGGEYGSKGVGAMLATKTFDAVFNGITVEGETGPFAERIWNTTSTPKHDARDMTGVEGTPLWSAGHLRRLGTDERPDLGATGLVSAPGAIFGDLPPWQPIETVGG